MDEKESIAKIVEFEKQRTNFELEDIRSIQIMREQNMIFINYVLRVFVVDSQEFIYYHKTLVYHLLLKTTSLFQERRFDI